MLQLEATLSAADHHPDQAVDSVITMVSLAHSLEHEASMPDQTDRERLLTNACETAERMVNRNYLTKTNLIRLQNAFCAAQDERLVTPVLVLERSCSIDLFLWPRPKVEKFAQMMNNPSSSGEVRQITDSFETNKAVALLPTLDDLDTLIAASKLPRPEFIQVVRSVLAQAEQQMRGFTGVNSLESTFRSTNIWKSYLSGTTKWILRSTVCLAKLRAAETAMAIEQYRLAHGGQLPPCLDALTPDYLQQVPRDPFDGAPLRFKRLSRGYVVYSVGEDGHDDGGTSADVTFTVEK
jgi:hypothetical protein